MSDRRIIAPPGFELPRAPEDYSRVSPERVEAAAARVLAGVSAEPVRKDEAISALMTAILTLLIVTSAKSELGWQCVRVFVLELKDTADAILACESREAFATWARDRNSRDRFEHGPAVSDMERRNE